MCGVILTVSAEETRLADEGRSAPVDLIVIGLSIAAGYRVAVCAETWATRMPVVALVGIAVAAFFIGRNTAVLRVDRVFEVMLNHVIMGIAVGALVFNVIRDRQAHRAGRADAVTDNADSCNASE
jgi:hypothetical protein